MDNTKLIEYALRKLEQNRSASKTYYDKVKKTDEYKEKRKRWNKIQYEKKKLILKQQEEERRLATTSSE